MLSPTRFFIAMAVMALLGTALVHGIAVFANTAGCDLRQIRAGEYLGGCSQKIYADYEHTALFYGLEPPSTQAMRRADVLFFGSSRTQAGWHPDVVESGLRAAGLSFFMLGFGFDEKMPFGQALAERHRLRPKVVVVNADPFFVNRLSAASRPIVEGGWEHRLSALFKRTHARAKTFLCRFGYVGSPVCAGDRLTVYRSRTTGTWRVLNWSDQRLPVAPDKASVPEPAMISGLSRNAASFAKALGVEPECMILTAVPSEVSSNTLVSRLAETIGSPSALPQVAGLKTYEGSHLRLDSARIWSEAFLAATIDRITACAARPSPTR